MTWVRATGSSRHCAQRSVSPVSPDPHLPLVHVRVGHCWSRVHAAPSASCGLHVCEDVSQYEDVWQGPVLERLDEPEQEAPLAIRAAHAPAPNAGDEQ